MFIPQPLKKGDTVALISASGATPPEKLQDAIYEVEKLGFRVVIGETCRARHGYLAGSDALRAKEMNEMFRDPAIDGIFCIRGGYGAMKILPLLDFEMIRQNPKVFAGYSDVTALHIAFNQLCGFVTYHTPMPSTEFIQQKMDQYTWDSFLQCVTTVDLQNVRLRNPASEEIQTLVPGEASGVLIGGNLTLVTASLGTPYEIDTKGKILFLEDIDENEQRVDRMLTQLQLAGKLDDAAGFILGGWTNCGPENPDHPERSLPLRTIFNEIIAPLEKPAVIDVACGHVLPTMSLPLGRILTLNATAKEMTIIR